MFKDYIFREYDVRGVFEKDFDIDFAYDIGAAYVELLKKKLGKEKICLSVGYDARISSPAVAEALCKGVLESGADVYRLGLITTPISYFSTFTLPIDGGFMITGSHNPPDYNGFKISKGKTTIFGEEIQELKAVIGEGGKSSPGTAQDYDIFPEYLEKYKKEFKDLKPINITLDCGNGAAGCIVRELYESVGLTPQILFEEPDGRFPNHHPDPTVEKNMADLKQAVKKNGSVVGIGFDGDADRIGIVDSNGRFILGDEIMILISRDILANNPGAKIIGDVKCSDRMYSDIDKHGGVPIMWKTGHSLIKNKIKAENSPFGGELSGHIFFSDRNHGYDDAPYAGLRLVEILSKTGKTIDELLEGVPSSFSTPEIRIDTTEEKKISIVAKVKAYLESLPEDEVKLNFIDGVRASYSNGWALVRSSNTQPVVVVRFEADNEDFLNKIQSEFMAIIEPML